MIDDLCRVIRFEPRGCGRSDWDGKYDLETLLCDADRIRQEYGLDRWIVSGHSAGPGFALAYALRYPSHTIGVIGIAGGSILNDREWSEAYHQGRDTVGEDNGGIEFSADPRVNPCGNVSWRSYIKRPCLLRDLAELSVRCVFINAGRDIRPNWPTRQLASLIPKAEYVEIPEATHYIWVTHHEALRRELRKAVCSVAADTRPPEDAGQA